jgi:hypothetical protein
VFVSLFNHTAQVKAIDEQPTIHLYLGINIRMSDETHTFDKPEVGVDFCTLGMFIIGMCSSYFTQSRVCSNMNILLTYLR